MKITDPGIDTVLAAARGGLAALDAVLVAIQPGVFNLAVRMLGNREDAADATQEILLKVVTHLGGFRAEAAFTTWVFQVARNHLLTASTRNRESPEVSLEAMAGRLALGLDFARAQAGADVALTPEDHVAARQMALGCTQNMLMSLDREQRLVYVLDVAFELSSTEAAQVLGITPEAYRQRLARARSRLDAFANGTCGLANAHAPCSCERQLPASRHVAAQAAACGTGDPPRLIAVHRAEQAQAQRQLEALLRMGDAAAVFRAHPDYRAPGAQLDAIRSVLRTEGYWSDRPLQ
jgi:RNA polymerase sigma factor (sigma-70 family)